MKRLLVSLVGMLAWIASATAQPMIPGVGSPMIPNATSGSGGGSFPPAGCSTANGVLFNNAAPCDSGFTYAGSGGPVSINGAALGATTGLLVNPATASGLLADFQVGGTSRANIDAVTGAYAISSDTFINRDAAGIFGLSNGAKDTGTVTLPAAQRIYNAANGGLSGGHVVNAALMEMGFAQHSGIAAIDVYKNGTGTLTNFGIYVGGTLELDYGITNGGWTSAITFTALSFSTGNNFQVTGAWTANSGNMRGASGYYFGFSSASDNSTVSDTILTRGGAANWQFGAANVNGAPVAQTISFQGALAASATNQASANTTIIGSLGTGTGTNGNMIFQVGVKTSTGTAQATATTALTLTGETLVASFAGSITAVLANAATTSAVCYNTGTGVLTYDGTVGTCTVSGRQFKNIIGDHDDFGPLRPATYRYKPESGFDDGRIHFGLIAQDVARMDDRCAVRNPVGEIINYEDRCVIAHLVADNDNLRAEIETIKRSIAR